ncbi:MAG TPA: hypothetical protein VKY74_18340 [Chloroflexia bacterium]|nr:hypothetical protein [Chloroflexia bacterium]
MRSLAVGDGGLILSYSVQPAIPPAPYNPAQRVADPHDPAVHYFPAVGHTLRAAFRTYWEAQGGLARFGYPISEEFPETDPATARTLCRAILPARPPGVRARPGRHSQRGNCGWAGASSRRWPRERSPVPADPAASWNGHHQ